MTIALSIAGALIAGASVFVVACCIAAGRADASHLHRHSASDPRKG
ncbi:hypothetical protein [Jannaschia formosa]|nr:hypothetical protein [Jannaschia formosa]